VLDDERNFALFGGCNRFSGRLAPSGGGLIFPEDFAGTMMACPDPVEAMERQILAALRQVADFVRYGSGLVMMDANGRAVLHFVATPE
jgi:putative lipoprotein